MISPLFPHRDLIRRAAQISLQVDLARQRGQVVSPDLLRINAALEARYARLSPMEQSFVYRTFQQDREQIAVAANQQVERQQQSEFAAQVDDLTRSLTVGLAGKANGLSMGLASALRNHDTVTVATRKLPVGEEADQRMQAATGLTTKQYEQKLDRALAVRDKAKNSDPGVWRDYVRANFPGESFTEVDRLVKGWQLESVGIELRRRAEADAPDTVKLHASPDDLRRLDIIEAISAEESGKPESTFHRGHAERLREIVEEGYDRDGQPRGGDSGLRRDIADAMLAHGAGFNINTGGYGEGHEGEFATDEIVAVDEEE